MSASSFAGAGAGFGRRCVVAPAVALVLVATGGERRRRRVRGHAGLAFRENEVDGVMLVPAAVDGRATTFHKAGRDVQRMGSEASRALTELDLASDAAGPPSGAQMHMDADGATDSLIPYHRWEECVVGHRKVNWGILRLPGILGIFADFSRNFYLTIQ